MGDCNWHHQNSAESYSEGDVILQLRPTGTQFDEKCGLRLIQMFASSRLEVRQNP
jgi:hypothetical protein